MKGKKGTYLLLIVVCGIWIGIAIEIRNAFSAENESIAIVDLPATNKKIQKIKKEKFTIQIADRDPFLGTLRKKKKVRKPQKKNTKPQKVVRWPRIKYKGIITDRDNKTAVFLIEVNGTVQLMKRGSNQSELTLIKGDKSSITLLHKKEQKEFTRVN